MSRLRATPPLATPVPELLFTSLQAHKIGVAVAHLLAMGYSLLPLTADDVAPADTYGVIVRHNVPVGFLLAPTGSGQIGMAVTGYGMQIYLDWKAVTEIDGWPKAKAAPQEAVV